MNLKDKTVLITGGSDWMDTDKVAELIAFIVEQDATMVMSHVVLNKRKTKTSN